MLEGVLRLPGDADVISEKLIYCHGVVGNNGSGTGETLKNIRGDRGGMG